VDGDKDDENEEGGDEAEEEVAGEADGEAEGEVEGEAEEDEKAEVDPQALKVAELRKELEKRGFCSKGLKGVLVERLMTALKGKGGASAGALTGDAGEDSSSTDARTKIAMGAVDVVVSTGLARGLCSHPLCSTTPSKVATPLLSGMKRRDGSKTVGYVCDSTALALECSFCNYVYHNTAQCIKAPNIASAESLTAGVHWACPLCWKETCQKAVGVLLEPAQP
jgi:hypothetical protein